MPKVIAGHAIRSPTLRSHWSAPRIRPLFKGNESSRNVPTTVQSRPDRLSYLFLLTWFVLTGNSKPRSGPKINYQYISNVKNTINQRATMVYKFVDSCLLFIILWTSLNHSGALSRAKFALRNTIGKKNLVLRKASVRASTPSCKPGWKFASQAPVRFGAKSHSFSDFRDTDNNNKADSLFRLIFNVYIDVDNRERARARQKTKETNFVEGKT